MSKGNEFFSKSDVKVLYALLAEFSFGKGHPDFSAKYFKLKT